MAGRPRKFQVLALCQLRGGQTRPEVGSIIEPGEHDDTRLRRGLSSGEFGYRVLDVAVTPDHLSLPLRRERHASYCQTLAPTTETQLKRDRLAAEQREAESEAEKQGKAKRELATAQAEHEAAGARLSEAEAAVSRLTEGDSNEH